MDRKKSEGFDKNIISSSHISFLFGAGVNGTALPQLSAFIKTKEKLEELSIDVSSGLEAGIDCINDEGKRESIKTVFIDEFVEYHKRALDDKVFTSNDSIRNLERLVKKTYLIVQEAQNRNPSMKQINVYTLNYDSIVEKLLNKLGYLYNSISASNNSSKAGLVNVIGYNYILKKYVPTYMVNKLHGDFDKPIIPGREKYKDILNDDYFEVAFHMKEQLSRPNTVLFVIGYSGRDKHINKILEDCLDGGLTLYWYKYSEDDYIPFEDKVNVIVRDQDDYDDKKDTTLVCYQDMEKVWGEKLERS